MRFIMKKEIFYFLILFFLILYGCGIDNTDKTIDGLIGHFRKNEIIGQKNDAIFAIRGAIDSCVYTADDFFLEIYKFDDENNFKKFHLAPYRNGYIGMLIHKPNEGKLKDKIIEVFRSY